MNIIENDDPQSITLEQDYKIPFKITNLENNTLNNFSKIVDLINLYNHLESSTQNQDGFNINNARNGILKEIERYFMTPFIIGFNKKKIYGKEFEINYLKELQVFKLLNHFSNHHNFYDQFLNHFITEITKNLQKIPDIMVSHYFINLLVNNDYGNQLINILDKNTVLNILSQINQINQGSCLFNIKDLAFLGYKPTELINLVNLQKELLYKTDHTRSILDINIIQERIKTYSQGLINSNFPFDKNKLIIAGGFAINCLIGTISRYTDIDIYIFNDFKEVVKSIVSYLEHECKCKIQMTCNKTIINIYLIDYSINFQLIKINGTIKQIIGDFDLSYSQVAILEWNNIQLTFDSYKSILTGFFTINRSAVIRNYRLVKAYIKGFKLDPIEFSKIINSTDVSVNQFIKNNHKLLDEVRNMIINLGILHGYDNFSQPDDFINNLEIFLKNYYQDDSNEYEIMTKSIYLTSNQMKNMSEVSIKNYLEKASKCNYFVISDLSNLEFESLKVYDEIYDPIEENYEKKDNNLSHIFPNIKDIILKKSKIKSWDPETNSNNIQKNELKSGNVYYPLHVITAEYYRSSKPLTEYYIKILVKISDLQINKIIGINENNNLKSVVKFKPNPQILQIIKDLDDHCQKVLYPTILFLNK